jgi:hypothetical protein
MNVACGPDDAFRKVEVEQKMLAKAFARAKPVGGDHLT